MSRVGCHLDWSYQVAIDTKIDPRPESLRSLPIGKKIYLINGSCKNKPSAEIAQKSREMLAADRKYGLSRKKATSVAQTKQVVSSKTTLPSESVDSLVKQRDAALSANDKLNDSLKVMDAKLVQTQQALTIAIAEAARAEGFVIAGWADWLMVVVFALIILLVGGFLYHLVLVWRDSRLVQNRDGRVIVDTNPNATT